MEGFLKCPRRNSSIDPNNQQYYIHTNNNIYTNKHIHRNRNTDTTTTMMKPATKMMSYQKSDDEETAVLLVPTILPTSTSTTTKWISRVASVAGVMLLVVAGGTVLMGDGGITTTTVEGLVVATQDGTECVPAALDATFYDSYPGSSIVPFQSCYQWGNDNLYCWTNSHLFTEGRGVGYDPCWPVGDGWHYHPNTHPNSCGKPCQVLRKPKH